MNFKRTDSSDIDFLNLVKALDQYLVFRDGEEHNYYVEYNQVGDLKNCVVLYLDNEAIGCGSIKPFDQDSMEIKRMFIKPDYRHKGYGAIVLKELEQWAKELGNKFTVLETGRRQIEAVNLYSKSYEVIPNYGQYVGVENSICFKKKL